MVAITAPVYAHARAGGACDAVSRPTPLAGAVAIALVVGAVYGYARATAPLLLMEVDAALDAKLRAVDSVAACVGYPNQIAARCAAYAVPNILAAQRATHPEWGSPCVQTKLVTAWAAAVAALPIRDAASTAPLDGEGGMWDWDALLPLVRCPGETRVGKASDGGKWTCLPLRQPARTAFDPATCLVYSFGVHRDGSWEEALYDEVACETHGFDPTPGLPSPYSPAADRISFHPWGLLDHDGSLDIEGTAVPGFTLASLMARLGHTGRHVQVMKVDVEGSEWAALAPYYAGGGSDEPQLFDQLLVELHVRTDRWSIMRLVVGLLERGYLPFHKELNGGQPELLTEASFVSLKWLAANEPACRV